MNLIKKQIEYLKNNPEGYWFKRKMYGLGWTPATREGWAVVSVYVLVLVGLSIRLERVGETEIVEHFSLPFGVATLVLLLITWRTGEPMKWQWGNKKENEKES